MRAGFGLVLGLVFAMSLVSRAQLSLGLTCAATFLCGVAFAFIAKRFFP